MLCNSMSLNTLDISFTVQRGRKLVYALPVKFKYELVESIEQHQILDFPNHSEKKVVN